MARPTFTPLTERAYARLPEFYRDDDDAQGDYPLLRYMSLVFDQAGAYEQLGDRIDPATNPTSTSDLVDPASADAAWLPWLALVYGARIPAGASDAVARNSVVSALGGRRVGTAQQIADAARTALTGGTGYISVQRDDADPWKINLSSDATVTPSGAAVIAAVIAADAKPAGVELTWTAYAPTWDLLEARYPTWNDIEAVPNFDLIETTH